MKTNLLIGGVVSLSMAALVSSAYAVAFSFEATDNATVQNAGPRTGANGKNFLNIEGDTAGGTSFDSFGVADFNFASLTPLGGTVGSVTSASILFTQSNAAFSAAGPVSIYYTAQTGVSIQPTNTGLNFAGGSGAATIDSDLTPASLLGTGNFTNVSNGTVDTYALTFSGDSLTALLSAINSGTTLRLLFTPDTDTVVATYAGFSHSTLAGPTLSLDVSLVPEPASLGLIAAGLPLALRRRRMV